MLSVDLSEYNRLAYAFSRAPATVQFAASEGLRDFAPRIEQRMKSLAPVRTGKLRRRIGFIAEFLNIVFIADTSYAGFVEHGTSRMRAQPYAWPAIQQLLPDLTSNLRDVIVERLEELFYS